MDGSFPSSSDHCNDKVVSNQVKKHMGDNDRDLRCQSPNQVLFTIGDSSDCESVSTTASGSNALTHPRNEDNLLVDNAVTNCCNDNPWHKFHFHNENINDNSAESATLKKNGKNVLNDDKDGVFRDIQIAHVNSDDNDEDCISVRRVTRGVSLSTTTAMIPTSANQSVAQLSEVDSLGDDSEGGCCFQNGGKWRILIGCAIVQLFSALMVSLQAPFYPAEAEKKGANATEYGFVFGVFELTVFIVAPFYGSRIHNWNPKFVFNLGIFTAATSSIIFGVLDKIDNANYFIAACACVRALEAVGESAVITATFVIVASAFSDSVAPTFAFLETFYSIGLISGPIVGSLLYEIGGYSLPFMVVGGGLVAAAILNFLILPSSREISEYQSNEPVIISSFKSFRLLGSIPVVVSAICIVIGAMSISYLQATLEPHLRQFHLTQLSVGAILIINGAVYTITAPFWGILCDKVLQLKLVTFCGSAMLIFGYSLVGPIPILSFKPAVWIIAVGLALQGIGLGAVLVASFVSILRTVLLNGIDDTPSTYGQVSSLWTSMFSLGSFIGPSLSGILYDSVGFSNGTLSIIVLTMIMMCILVLFVCTSDAEMNSFNYSENEPLLSTSIAGTASVFSQQQQPSNNTPTTFLNRWTSRSRRRNSYNAI